MSLASTMAATKRASRNSINAGDRFGMLSVVERVENDSSNKPRYALRCDCGNSTEASGSNLKRKDKPTFSCGCVRRQPPPLSAESKRKIGDRIRKIKPGDRYGLLTVIERSPDQHAQNKSCTYYRCECDCGAVVDVPNKKLRRQAAGRGGNAWNLHCNDAAKHGKRLHYPKTPAPYPTEAGALLAEYIYLLKRFESDRTAHEIASERLTRACFIVYWRQRYARPVGDIKRYLQKSVRFSRIDERRAKAAEVRGGVLYNSKGMKIIGGDMTDATISVEAVIETLPECMLPEIRRVVRFNRC